MVKDIRAEDGCLILECQGTAAFLTGLDDHLSDIEALDTRVLITDTKQPVLGDFGNVLTLEGAMQRVRGAWLIDILDRNNYASYAQPIVSVDGKREALGHELLFRGFDEAGAIIAPDILFGAAKDPRIFFNLDRTARLSAVHTASRMDASGQIFINFMPGAIYDPEVCLRTTVSAIEEHDIAPERVVFEIVESQRIEDLKHLRSIVNFYRDAGFRIALDDFGAGHSNLEALIALDPNFVKLDKSLSSNLTPQDSRVVLVKSVIRACHSADIAVIAEGIESEENAVTVTDCGVDYMQGYYFGRPKAVPPKE